MRMIQLIDSICLIMSQIKNAFYIILRCPQYFTNLSYNNITEKNKNSKSKIITRVIRHSTLSIVKFQRGFQFLNFTSIIN
ncbi:unnamed protein product [Paramecium sonneborni]|uniref:Uncharacterized protein n=1 Tax=Paramecium sonneborni TaxID=65129 RepID=A0A8S1Q732_9CILI|nr:unnamed protein product [Paramecium sonneborni]